MDFVDPKITSLSVTYNDITYTTDYYNPAVKITGVTDQSYPDWSESIVTAGSFVVGLKYQIVTIGTTDFTLIGASANTVGVVFTATGVGTGTGTAQSAYNTGDYVIIPELKRIFRSASDANVGKFPLAYLDTDWVDYGVINSYAMFATDENIGSKTTGTDSIFEFNFSVSNTIVGTDLDFVSADVLLINTDGINYLSDYVAGTTYAVDDAVVYNNSLWVSLLGSNTGNTPDVSPTYWVEAPERIFFDQNILGTDIGVPDFAAYFFAPIAKRTRYILTGLEWLPHSILRIKFTGALSIGTICLGRQESLGASLVGAKLRYQSTSKIKENSFTGFRDVIRYGKIRILEVDVIYDRDLFASTSQKIERIIDKNIVWIPTEEDTFSEAITIGYIENFDLPMDDFDISKSTTRIVGVST